MQLEHGIRSLLRNIGAISDSRVERFAERTRDRAVPVWHDPHTGVIFIDDFYVGNEEYETGAYRGDGASGGYEDLFDTQRRIADFKPLLVGRSILDFGCGAGSFLRSAKSFASRVQGVELQESYRLALNQDGIPCFSVLSDCAPPDVAFMFHVLEHLPNPLATLKMLHDLTMASKGSLVVEVPHARDFLISYARNRPFIDFTLWSQHLVLHTRQSLELLLRASGYTDVHIYGIQRYGLANHLQWLIDGLPGGHTGPLSAMETGILNQDYSAALARMDATDTLVAVAR